MTDQSKSEGSLDRRDFVRAGAATALSAAAWERVYGANERIGMGFIGYGLVGERHFKDFAEQPDVAMVGIAEAHRGRREEAAAFLDGRIRQHSDFRRLLDDKDVDAVCISTPDHWHALAAMLACSAGKDVYVEKPLTLFVREGRWMVNIAERFGRVVQVGTQQRSGKHYQRARRFFQEGGLGKLVTVRMEFHRNLMPGFGHPPDEEPPPDLDWEMFSGPAPLSPYNFNRGIYQFRWFWDYSGGQMTNWGQHSFDIVHWFTGTAGPTGVYSHGGRWFLDDNCDVPDTQEAILEYPGWTAVASVSECSKGSGTRSLTFLGTKGSMTIDRGGFSVAPDPLVDPLETMPRYEGSQPVGGLVGVPKRHSQGPRTEPIDDRSGDDREQFRLHVRDFLDCVKTRRQPLSDLESGHRVATALHLANISLRLGRGLRWDPEREEITGDPAAALMLERPYRKPWDKELDSLRVNEKA